MYQDILIDNKSFRTKRLFRFWNVDSMAAIFLPETRLPIAEEIILMHHTQNYRIKFLNSFFLILSKNIQAWYAINKISCSVWKHADFPKWTLSIINVSAGRWIISNERYSHLWGHEYTLRNITKFIVACDVSVTCREPAKYFRNFPSFLYPGNWVRSGQESSALSSNINLSYRVYTCV